MHDGPDVPAKSAVVLDRIGRNGGLLASLALALLGLAIANPSYMRWDNFVVVMLQMSFIGIAALGTAHLIIGGNVDLSVGSIYALCAVAAAMMSKTMPVALAIVAGIALGGLVGWLNGLLVWRVKMSPIIVTLGSLAIVRGFALLLTGGYAVRNVPHGFATIGQARPLGVPSPVWAIALCAAAAYVVLHKTTIGRYLFAIGGSPEGAAAAGIPVRRMILGTFAMNGAVVGLAGVLAASRFGSATPYFGAGFELDVITAVSLGGVAFKGGEGDVPGVILAVVLLGVMNSGLVSLGIDPHYTQIVKGGALLIAVLIDQITQERREAYRKSMALRDLQGVGA
jgi:ribose/xylose/arabinose/galactoside ABC-type transport system permease subunit